MSLLLTLGSDIVPPEFGFAMRVAVSVCRSAPGLVLLALKVRRSKALRISKEESMRDEPSLFLQSQKENVNEGGREVIDELTFR